MTAVASHPPPPFLVSHNTIPDELLLTSSSHHHHNNNKNSINDNTPNNNNNGRRPAPFTMPKKLGSDRLLLVCKALHETPTYKSISPELQHQRKCLKRHNSLECMERRVHFRAVDEIHVYEKQYDERDHGVLWWNDDEFAHIFERDDRDFTECYKSMQHTRQILSLWGMCSRPTPQQDVTSAVDKVFQQAPRAHARGLEQRIVTGIRNHRQKAVQSFLQHHKEGEAHDHNNSRSSLSVGMEESTRSLFHFEDEAEQLGICPRYLKFSKTSGRFSRALAEGDARVAQAIQEEEDDGDYESDDDGEEYDQWEYR